MGFAPMYRYNTARSYSPQFWPDSPAERDVGSQRQEISTDTFEAHRFGSVSPRFIPAPDPLIGTVTLNSSALKGKRELIRKFERYAAGGLEYLRGSMSRSADSSGQSVIRTEIQRAQLRCNPESRPPSRKKTYTSRMRIFGAAATRLPLLSSTHCRNP